MNLDETQQLTLTQFLTARLAEDEEEARLVGRGDNWHLDGGHSWASDRPVELVGGGKTLAEFDDDHGGAAALHIVRHNPPRVLAQCAAMWQIMELHSTHAPDFCDICSRLNADHDGFEDEHPYPCPTLAALASIWSDHPDFNPDWA